MSSPTSPSEPTTTGRSSVLLSIVRFATRGIGVLPSRRTRKQRDAGRTPREYSRRGGTGQTRLRLRSSGRRRGGGAEVPGVLAAGLPEDELAGARRQDEAARLLQAAVDRDPLAVDQDGDRHVRRVGRVGLARE